MPRTAPQHLRARWIYPAGCHEPIMMRKNLCMVRSSNELQHAGLRCGCNWVNGVTLNGSIRLEEMRWSLAGMGKNLADTASSSSTCADLVGEQRNPSVYPRSEQMFSTTRIRGYGLVAMTFDPHAKGREFDPHYPYCFIAQRQAGHGRQIKVIGNTLRGLFVRGTGTNLNSSAQCPKWPGAWSAGGAPVCGHHGRKIPPPGLELESLG